MKWFHSKKGVCLRLRVSFENQERMSQFVDSTFSPLFALKRGQFVSVKFENRFFTGTFQKEKIMLPYRNIKKIETQKDGLIIYLNNGTYLAIAVEEREKHNSCLFDLLLLLKRRFGRKIAECAEIQYPDEDAARYRTDEEPIAHFSFSLSEKEIGRMLWYDYLIDEKMLAFLVPAAVFAAWALLSRDARIFLPACFCMILPALQAVWFIRERDGYVQNHQGALQALLLEDVMVIRLRDTDLELEYAAMKRLKNRMGLWRMKSGDFFVLTLPGRIESENRLFFEALYTKVK